MWPRDALYICYKEEKFEYVQDMESQGDTPYYCDCCDPARQKKRQCSESESDDAEDEDGKYSHLPNKRACPFIYFRKI